MDVNLYDVGNQWDDKGPKVAGQWQVESMWDDSIWTMTWSIFLWF